MAEQFSFDVVSKVNLQEVDNAINQSMKEITQRFDFKGSVSKITRTELKLDLVSDEEMKKLMIETSAQLATALYLRRIAPDYHHQFLEAHRRFSCGDWDREATVYQLPASPRIACPRCEKDVQTRWRFCPSCGLSVEKK